MEWSQVILEVFGEIDEEEKGVAFAGGLCAEFGIVEASIDDAFYGTA